MYKTDISFTKDLIYFPKKIIELYFIVKYYIYNVGVNHDWFSSSISLKPIQNFRAPLNIIMQNKKLNVWNKTRIGN